MATTQPAPAEKLAEKPAKKPDTLFVQDTTCTPNGGAREHVQIIGGAEKTFSFEYKKKVEMPSAVAMKFLKIAEFIVTDHEGKTVERVPDQPDQHAIKPFLLKEDQVIAQLTELSDNALLKRAMQMVGGERMQHSGRDRLISFLLAARRAADEQRRGKSDDEPAAFAAYNAIA
jgi:hypothetical protein